MTTTPNNLNTRKLSIDQFSGFAIFGMIMVNYLNHLAVIPETFKHPHYGMTCLNTGRLNVSEILVRSSVIGTRCMFCICFKPAEIYITLDKIINLGDLNYTFGFNSKQSKVEGSAEDVSWCYGSFR